jgi:hypothetical protein
MVELSFHTFVICIMMKRSIITHFFVLLILFLGIRLENWATEYDRYMFLDGDESISYLSTITAVTALNEYINNMCPLPSSKNETSAYHDCRDFYMKINGWVSSEYAKERGREALDALDGWKGKLSRYVIYFFGSHSYELENNSSSKKGDFIINKVDRFSK